MFDVLPTHEVPAAVLAHADHGGGGLEGMFLVVAVISAAALWLVRMNRRLDDTEDPMPRRRWSKAEIVLSAGLTISIIVFFVLVLRNNHPPAEAQVAVDDLCRAAQQAESDTGAAYDTFNGSPHAALHQVDTDLRREDPVLALRVADAKSAAESALNAGSPQAATLTADLADAMADAYEALGEEVDRCSP